SLFRPKRATAPPSSAISSPMSLEERSSTSFRPMASAAPLPFPANRRARSTKPPIPARNRRTSRHEPRGGRNLSIQGARIWEAHDATGPGGSLNLEGAVQLPGECHNQTQSERSRMCGLQRKPRAVVLDDEDVASRLPSQANAYGYLRPANKRMLCGIA